MKKSWLTTFATPTAVYTILFVALTYPAIFSLSEKLIGGGDALQNLWNLWWSQRAFSAGQSPWFTHEIYFPYGTTLVPHTLSFLDDLIAYPLQAALSPICTYNILIVFSFVASGVTTFWLVNRFTHNRLAALFGGFVFAFCEYHFAHARGHLNLSTCQWIPLFFLAWIQHVEKPSLRRAVGAATVLSMVFYSDYYYFIFSVFGAIFTWAWARGWRMLGTRQASFSYLAFCGLVLAFCGPVLVPLVLLTREIKGHDPSTYSLDLLAPLVPGLTSRLAEKTSWFWSQLPSQIEGAAFYGLSAIALAAVAWRQRAFVNSTWVKHWLVFTLFFTSLALGPTIQIVGNNTGIPGPYQMVSTLMPALRSGGAPARFALLAQLGLAVLAGIGLSWLLSQSARHKTYAAVACFFALFEFWPAPLPLTQLPLPEYVELLANSPHGAIFDVDGIFDGSMPAYYQTIHEHPLNIGDISRRTASVLANDHGLRGLAQSGKWQELCETFGFKYFVFARNRHAAVPQDMATIYADAEMQILDAGASHRCEFRADAEPPRANVKPWHAPDRGTVARGQCCIDYVNSSTAVNRPHQIDSEGSMFIGGWALDTISAATPTQVSILLENESGQKFTIPAARRYRRDVAQAFDSPKYLEAGIVLNSSLRGMRPGCYQLKILQGPEEFECDPHTEINLE